MNPQQRAIVRGLLAGQGELTPDAGGCPTPLRKGYPSRAAAFADVPLTAPPMIPGVTNQNGWRAYLCPCAQWHFRDVH